jgi:hypothetical protein
VEASARLHQRFDRRLCADTGHAPTAAAPAAVVGDAAPAVLAPHQHSRFLNWIASRMSKGSLLRRMAD